MATRIYTVGDRSTLEMRVSVTPQGKARIVVSPPKGFFGEGRCSLDIPSEIQHSPYPKCPWPARTDLKPGWGKVPDTMPLSRKTRLNIQETIAAMDRAFPLGRNPLRIVTFTLPSVSVRAFQALAAWSSYAVNRLNTWLGRRLGPHARCGVWEWQKRGALHYHCVIGAYDPWRWKGFDFEVKEQWIDILKDIMLKTGADMFLSSIGGSHLDNPHNIQVDCQVVRKSAAAYLSKYLSKGGDEDDEEENPYKLAWKCKKSGCFYAPPRWFNCNSEATRLRKKYTYSAIIARFPGYECEKALGLGGELLEMVCHKDYRVLKTHGIGYAMECIYAILEDWDDCMDAIKWAVEAIPRLLKTKRWLWSGLRRFGVAYSY